MDWQQHLEQAVPMSELEAALERAHALEHDGERRRFVHWVNKHARTTVEA